jgi:Cation transporting ATPase, C-terminus
MERSSMVGSEAHVAARGGRPALNVAIVSELLTLALVISVPFLQDAFGTVALAADEWLRIVALAVLIVPVLEGAKWAVGRGWLGGLRRARPSVYG